MTRPTDALRLVPVSALPDEIDLFRIIRRAGRSNREKALAVSVHLDALAAAPASPLPEVGGQCSGISGELKSPDLDALEKLADEALLPMPDRRRRSWFNRQRRFSEAANPATIKALIAEVRRLQDRVARWEPPLMTSTASSSCSAFLARNGKGEEPHTPRNAPRGLSDEC